MIALLKVPRQLLEDVLWFASAALRPTRVVAAESLFLRRQFRARRVAPATSPRIAPTRARAHESNLLDAAQILH